MIIKCMNLLNVLKVYGKHFAILRGSQIPWEPSDDFSNIISVKLIKI